MNHDNASIGEHTIIEPDVSVGFRYHPDCGPARVGAHAILRKGTLIYGDVTLGDYFQSGHYTVIRAKVRMGDYCTVSNHSTIEGLVRFGSGVRVMSQVYVPSRTWIGDNVFIGPGTRILNDRFPGRTDAAVRGPTIGNDVMIGGGVTVLPGVKIGDGSFIAAGAVVVRDVPPLSMVVGPRGEIKPLPPHIAPTNSPRLTRQPVDLWHPLTDISALEWPQDWPESYRNE